MNFVSATFLGFLAAVILLYFAAPNKIKWIVLLIASYAYYLFSGLENLAFILVTTASTFCGGLYLGTLWDRQRQYLADLGEGVSDKDKKAYKAAMKKKRGRVTALVLLLNFGILIFLKYYNFAASTADTLLGLMGIRKFIPEFDLLLPLGISFYTFQSMGYLLDVNKGKYAPDRNLAKFALFVSFFPQILQGPIGRYDDLAHQLYAPHRPEYRRCKFGFQLMVWGYFQKIVIADRLSILCVNVFDHYMNFAGFELLAASLLYGVQLYCDFAGGINIVRGVAQILGVELAENFRQPFFAVSLADFWRRWHISLGNWMKDYLFYPLAMAKPVKRLSRWAGKRFGLVFGSLVPNCIPSLVIFFLIGIWHGASWKYVAFGLFNGGIIAASVLLTPVYNNMNTALRIKTESFGWKLFRMARTLFVVTLSRMLVRPDSLSDAWTVLVRTFTVWNPWVLFDGSLYNLGLDRVNLNFSVAAMAVLLVVGILREKGVRLRERLDEQGIIFRWLVMMAAILSVLIFGVYGPAFVASEFIYQAF